MGVDLITKGMLLKTLEMIRAEAQCIDAPTEYEGQRDTAQNLLNSVFQQERHCLGTVKTGGKDFVLGLPTFPPKQFFNSSPGTENAAFMLERQYSHFLLPHIVICDLLFVRFHSCCSTIQGCLGRETFFCTYKHVFL